MLLTPTICTLGLSALTRAPVIARLELALVSQVMMVSLVSEQYAPITAMAVATAILSESLRRRQTVFTPRLGTTTRLWDVCAMLDFVALLVNSKSAHLALTLWMDMVTRAVATVRDVESATTQRDCAHASPVFLELVVNTKQL